jgi:hypothetical protein
MEVTLFITAVAKTRCTATTRAPSSSSSVSSEVKPDPAQRPTELEDRLGLCLSVTGVGAMVRKKLKWVLALGCVDVSAAPMAPLLRPSTGRLPLHASTV